MVTPLRLLTLLILLLLQSMVWAADFTASLERTEIHENDSFTLVLRIDEQIFTKQPDLTPLEEHFHILNQQRSQQYRSVNGQTESFTRWHITLSAKQSGELTIPAIALGKAKTQPLTLRVIPLSEATKQQANDDYFFDITVTPESQVFVQSQLLYTEKLYYRYDHERPTLTELKVTDAKVQALGDVRQYNTLIEGKTFGVYERQYAIFPEVSGELVIPGTRFEAYSMRRGWEPSRPIKATAKPTYLTVLPIPDTFPKNTPWLASSKLTLTEQFSVPPKDWKVGEAITRTFTLSAQGISGKSLPELPLPDVNGVRFYPDQTKTDDLINSFGILGRSEHSVAMVITQAGDRVFPEIRLPWWNTNTDTLEYATLPARQIHLQGEVQTPTPLNDTAPTFSAIYPSEENHSEWNSHTPLSSIEFNTDTILLIGLLAVSMLGNLIGFYYVFRNKRSKATTPETTIQSPQPSLDRAWNAFKNSCQQQDAHNIRLRLLEWLSLGGLSHLPPTQSFTGFNPVLEHIKTPALKLALQELDATLYAPAHNSALNAQSLLELIKQEKAHSSSPSKPSLYPQSL